MKGQYRPFNDGYGIVGYSYLCPQCGHETMFTNSKNGCEKCGFSEEYVDPDEWYEEHLKAHGVAIEEKQ
jgi:uncharacterized protein (DUF983 family)